MCAVGQVDRVEVVEVPVGKLHQAGAVDVDLVEVERLLVVRLEAEDDLLAVVGEVGPPERAVQRRLRHELPHLAVGRKPLQHQQPPARHGHVAQAVARLVLPLRALRKRHVDEQHLVEVHDRVLEHHGPLHLRTWKYRPWSAACGVAPCFSRSASRANSAEKSTCGNLPPLIRSIIRRVQRISSWMRWSVGRPSA